MDKAKVWKVLWLSFFLCCCYLGCETVNSPATLANGKPDPFVEEIVKQEAFEKTPAAAKFKPDAILKAIPLQTPLEQARAVMEGHGFSCWAGVPGTYGPCLQCTVFKPKNQYVADKIVVKLYYQKKRISNVEASVEYNVEHAEHGFVARN
jgi:hypothetical protein